MQFLSNCWTNGKSNLHKTETTVRAPIPQGTARYPPTVRCTTQKPSDTETMLSIHCPVKDTPWVPWDPNSGFPTAGFSCLCEGQPQAETPTHWQAQSQPPGSMNANTTAKHPEPPGNHRYVFVNLERVEFFCHRVLIANDLIKIRNTYNFLILPSFISFRSEV